uniref:Uncharacterized protein n=1 Tax=Romanomermis culicivorax TaxID=13658 RepID=A0A915JHX6_ROMCU
MFYLIELCGLVFTICQVKAALYTVDEPRIFNIVIKAFNGRPRTKALLGLMTLPNQTYIDAFAIGYAAAMPDDYDQDDEFNLYCEIFSTRSGDEIQDIMEAWDNAAQIGGNIFRQIVRHMKEFYCKLKKMNSTDFAKAWYTTQETIVKWYPTTKFSLVQHFLANRTSYEIHQCESGKAFYYAHKLEDFRDDPHAKCLIALLNGIMIGRKEVYPVPCKP